MLNKAQSQKKNSWKYALILPALTAFMFFFQIKTIAQEIKENQKVAALVWSKNATEEEFKEDAKRLKELGVTLKFSKIKRNNKGEITAIKIEYKDANGKTGMTHIQDDEPIKPIYFHKTRDKIGFGKSNEIRIAHHLNDDKENNFGFSFLGDDKDIMTQIEKIEIPDTPEAPEVLEEIEKIETPLAPLAPESADAPKTPKAPKMKSFNKSIIIKKQNDGKPEIIVNGKKLDVDSDEYKKMTEDFDGKFEFKMDENGPMVFKFNDDEMFKFNSADIDKITKEALENSKLHMRKMRERMQKMQDKEGNMKIEIEKIKPEDFNFNFNWDDKENSETDMKKAREEMQKAREEMLKARDEMLKAKEEMLKAKAQGKTRKA